MSDISELISKHAAIFERPELRIEPQGARIRFEIGQEVWLAESARERLVLRPARRDERCDLVAVLKPEDFARHVRGELDLFDSLEPRLQFGCVSGDRPREDHILLLRRILDVLGLSCQSDARFRGSVIEQLYLADRSERDDGGFEPMGQWSLPFCAGRILYDLVTSKGLKQTIEVGMAHALSTLFIAQALRDGGGGHHVVIDPWQSTGFGRAGARNVERAGLESFVELVEEPNYVALPRLLAARPGGFELAFIDGLHIFDHVLLDSFYCDLLLGEGGYLVFDDSTLPAVRAVQSFLLENRSDSFERRPELCTERITVFTKTRSDARIERFGVVFHRPFTTTAPEIAPLPPPDAPRVLKRAFDLLLAMPAAAALLPVGLAIALAIKVEDRLTGERPASPFERLPRLSGNKPFDLLRFRTFRASEGPEHPSRVGRILGRFHLAGLPQILQIVTGRLSFVGPCPIAAHEQVRRRAFRDCGMRPGVVGLQSLDEGLGGKGGEYYRDYARRSQLSLLRRDLSILGKALLRFTRGPAAQS